MDEVQGLQFTARRLAVQLDLLIQPWRSPGQLKKSRSCAARVESSSIMRPRCSGVWNEFRRHGLDALQNGTSPSGRQFGRRGQCSGVRVGHAEASRPEPAHSAHIYFGSVSGQWPPRGHASSHRVPRIVRNCRPNPPGSLSHRAHHLVRRPWGHRPGGSTGARPAPYHAGTRHQLAGPRRPSGARVYERGSLAADGQTAIPSTRSRWFQGSH